MRVWAFPANFAPMAMPAINHQTDRCTTLTQGCPKAGLNLFEARRFRGLAAQPAGSSMLLDRRVSPQGPFAWVVERITHAEGNTDIALGFEGQSWRAYPFMFDRRDRRDEEIAEAVTEAVVTDQLVILEIRGDKIHECGLAVDLKRQLKYKSSDEEWECRFWSGKRVEIDDLLAGSMPYLPMLAA